MTEDQRFLSIQAAQTTAGNLLRIKDLNRPDSDFVEVDSNPESDTYVVASKADQVLVYTNDQAPNGRLVAIDLNAPEPVNWIDVIPEREMPLRVSTGAGYLFAHYLLDARSRLFQYDYEGNLIRELPLPEVGSASRPRVNSTMMFFIIASAITKLRAQSMLSTLKPAFLDFISNLQFALIPQNLKRIKCSLPAKTEPASQ